MLISTQTQYKMRQPCMTLHMRCLLSCKGMRRLCEALRNQGHVSPFGRMPAGCTSALAAVSTGKQACVNLRPHYDRRATGSASYSNTSPRELLPMGHRHEKDADGLASQTDLVAGELQAAHEVPDLLGEAAASEGGVQLPLVLAALPTAGVALQERICM